MIDAYSIIFNCTESDLDEITNDENTPLALTIIIKELQNKVTRARAMQDYRDYCYGRAKENIDHTTKGKEIKSSSGIDYSKLSM